MTKQQVMAELRQLIIDACHIEEEVPEEVDPAEPLIGPESPFGLDSLDAVEIVVAVQKAYNVHIGGQESSRAVLASLGTLADYILQEKVEA